MKEKYNSNSSSSKNNNNYNLLVSNSKIVKYN